MPYLHHLRRPAAAVLALFLALSLALAGCGTPASGSSEPAATAEASPQPTAGTAARPVDTEPGEVPTVLPETKDAGRSYVEETLFLGDSNTVRYMMYADETGEAFTSLANNIGVVSMGAGAIKTLKCERFKGDSSMYTMPDAVAKLKPRRIIIGFGTNNLGGKSTNAENFIATYKKGLAAIAEAWPYADIIVNAIPPLDEKRSNTNLYMVQVDAYNEALAEMCEEEGYHFLNSAEALRDPKTGWAKKDYTLSDGVHLSKLAVTAFFEYVRTHAYITEDRRPQPLGKIPTPDGVPLGLITKDPIASRDPKVPVEFVVRGEGHLEGETSQMVKKGGTCSAVRAVAAAGWAFQHWEISLGSGDAGNETMVFTVPGNADANGVILTAVFQPAAHEHKWVEVEGTRVNATCAAPGTVKCKCSVCGSVEEQVLEKLPHTWGPAYQMQESAENLQKYPALVGRMVHACSVCGAIALDETATPEPAQTPGQEPTQTAAPSNTPGSTPDNTSGGTPSTQPTDQNAGGDPTKSPDPTNTPTSAPTEQVTEPKPDPEPDPDVSSSTPPVSEGTSEPEGDSAGAE